MIVRTFIVAMMLLVTAACGGLSAGSNRSGVQTPTAQQILDHFNSKGLPVKDEEIYTADTDPNHFLGRPNEYVGKANWQDARDGAQATPPPSVETLAPGEKTLVSPTPAGGSGSSGHTYSVEVFSDSGVLAARKQYIEQVTKGAGPMLCEYDAAVGLVLLRISCALTPTQNDQYVSALKEIAS